MVCPLHETVNAPVLLVSVDPVQAIVAVPSTKVDVVVQAAYMHCFVYFAKRAASEDGTIGHGCAME